MKKQTKFLLGALALWWFVQDRKKKGIKAAVDTVTAKLRKAVAPEGAIPPGAPSADSQSAAEAVEKALTSTLAPAPE